MSTTGMVSVTGENNRVALKVIARCNGINVGRVVFALEEWFLQHQAFPTLDEAWKIAKWASFGCDDCLVVMNEESAKFRGNPPDQVFRNTFRRSRFNPHQDPTDKCDRVVRIGHYPLGRLKQIPRWLLPKSGFGKIGLNRTGGFPPLFPKRQPALSFEKDLRRKNTTSKQRR